VLIDPLDPALAGPPATARPEPLAVLEAESIAALAGSGFTVVVADQRPVVPSGPSYRGQTATLDLAACGRRLAGDLGAGLLVFVTGDDGPPRSGDVDRREAEDRLARDEPYAAEIVAATRFLRAGGELAVLTTAAELPGALSSTSGDGAALRIHRTLDRPRADR
jgi:carbamate kinase